MNTAVSCGNGILAAQPVQPLHKNQFHAVLQFFEPVVGVYQYIFVGVDNVIQLLPPQSPVELEIFQFAVQDHVISLKSVFDIDTVLAVIITGVHIVDD